MLALVPLDNRPCNARFPLQIAAIGGDCVVTPPQSTLGRFNTPGDSDNIARWLAKQHDVEALIVSVDMLAYGGLVASRRSLVDEKTALSRLESLREFRAQHPDTPIYAFNVLMRLAITLDGDGSVPHYYNVMRYARLADEAERFGSAYLRDELRKVLKEIPTSVLDEYHAARARNHTINNCMIEWLDEGIFDTLLITQEDATEWGLHRREQDVLLRRARELGVEDKFSLHPGADEAALTLLARHWNSGVSFRVHWSNPADAARIAPFEDRPYNASLHQHIAAMCGVVVEEIGAPTSMGNDLNGSHSHQGHPHSGHQSTLEADFELFVNAPAGSGSQHEEKDDERAARRAQLEPFAEELTEAVESGRAVALCDVAFPNGGDNTLLGLLEKRGVLSKLIAFSAWNTAGNSTGTVLATCAALKCAQLLEAVEGSSNAAVATAIKPAQSATVLARHFLFERLVDDWFYQSRVRYRLDKSAREREASPLKMTPEENEPIEAQARRELRGFAQLLAQRHFHNSLARCDIALPWHRTFEVDLRTELS